MLIENKKAGFNYEILETLTSGIELFGFEVKSIRNKNASLEGSHVTVRGGESYLIGAHIPPFQPKNAPVSYDPERNRRLLLTRKEIKRLADIEDKKGFTVVPLSLFASGRKIKCTIAIARGKKKYDKRESMKKRDAERESRRAFKSLR